MNNLIIASLLAAASNASALNAATESGSLTLEPLHTTLEVMSTPIQIDDGVTMTINSYVELKPISDTAEDSSWTASIHRSPTAEQSKNTTLLAAESTPKNSSVRPDGL